MSIDGGSSVRIGYASPKEAVEAMLANAGHKISSEEPGESDKHSPYYRVEQEKRDGMTMAYALRWQPYYRNWAFTNLAGLISGNRRQQPRTPTAVCVQGVRVQSNSPGFASAELLAISNVTGTRSPATNVARSNLEASTQVDEMFTKAYSIYAAHIASEIKEMTSSRGASISTAASEGRYLLSSLRGSLPIEECPSAAELLNAQLRTVPCLTLDEGDERKLVSIQDLEEIGGFWTTEGSAYRSAEELMRRIRTGVSMAKLARSIGTEEFAFKDRIVGGYAENTTASNLLFGAFEVDQIEILRDKRQVNLHWRKKTATSTWSGLVPRDMQTDEKVSKLIQQFGRQIGRQQSRYRGVALQNSEEITISGLGEEVGIKTVARTYILNGNPVHRLLHGAANSLDSGDLDPGEYAFLVLAVNQLLVVDWVGSEEDRLRHVEVLRQLMRQNLNIEINLPDELRALISAPPRQLFDPMWGERSPLFYDYTELAE